MTDTSAINDVYNKTVQPNMQDHSKDLLKQTQLQVDELVEILQDTTQQAMNRETKLSHLTEISRDMENNADIFKNHTIDIKRKEWWKHMKTKLVFAGLAALVLIIIICSIFL
ncbi:vesicle-associated membrane protein 2-like [Calliphora vicina]|uniref:vesicle-associated membrane protein 2-like n=1 Tax=Calliphora vicina TaxID=7373 RepID=UPI00325C06E8